MERQGGTPKRGLTNRREKRQGTSSAWTFGSIAQRESRRILRSTKIKNPAVAFVFDLGLAAVLLIVGLTGTFHSTFFLILGGVIAALGVVRFAQSRAGGGK
jgi:hypothetical protein